MFNLRYLDIPVPTILMFSPKQQDLPAAAALCIAKSSTSPALSTKVRTPQLLQNAECFVWRWWMYIINDYIYINYKCGCNPNTMVITVFIPENSENCLPTQLSPVEGRNSEMNLKMYYPPNGTWRTRSPNMAGAACQESGRSSNSDCPGDRSWAARSTCWDETSNHARITIFSTEEFQDILLIILFTLMFFIIFISWYLDNQDALVQDVGLRSWIPI